MIGGLLSMRIARTAARHAATALALVTILLTGCAGMGSEPGGLCPPVVAYSRANRRKRQRSWKACLREP